MWPLFTQTAQRNVVEHTYLCNCPTLGERHWLCRISPLLLPLLPTTCRSPGNQHTCPLSGQSGWEELRWTVPTRRPAETGLCSCRGCFCGDGWSCVKHVTMWLKKARTKVTYNNSRRRLSALSRIWLKSDDRWLISGFKTIKNRISRTTPGGKEAQLRHKIWRKSIYTFCCTHQEHWNLIHCSWEALSVLETAPAITKSAYLHYKHLFFN